MDMGVTQRRFPVHWGLGWVSDNGLCDEMWSPVPHCLGQRCSWGLCEAWVCFLLRKLSTKSKSYCKVTTLVFEPLCQKVVQNFEIK